MKSARNLILVAVALIAFILIAMSTSFYGRTSTQRRAIDSLQEIANEALMRAAARGAAPPDFGVGFFFDARGPHFIEDFTGPAYFGNVTGVIFSHTIDDQQIVASIPHLQKLEHLEEVRLFEEPSPAIMQRLRDALPRVELAGEDGTPIPEQAGGE